MAVPVVRGRLATARWNALIAGRRTVALVVTWSTLLPYKARARIFLEGRGSRAVGLPLAGLVQRQSVCFAVPGVRYRFPQVNRRLVFSVEYF